MICAPTDSEAYDLLEDMKWFWDTWPVPFGQPMPKLLVGSPDTISVEIEKAMEIVPINEVMMLIPQGIHEPNQICSSLELFAEKVIPRFS